jgi:hypothetical protein
LIAAINKILPTWVKACAHLALIFYRKCISLDCLFVTNKTGSVRVT